MSKYLCDATSSILSGNSAKFLEETLLQSKLITAKNNYKTSRHGVNILMI